jgi:hypothetical protein
MINNREIFLNLDCSDLMNGIFHCRKVKEEYFRKFAALQQMRVSY